MPCSPLLRAHLGRVRPMTPSNPITRPPRGLALIPASRRRTVRMTPMAWIQRRKFFWQRIEIMQMRRRGREFAERFYNQGELTDA